jgi:prefoldin subunit 5
MEEYVYDLENTWGLNIEMFETMFPDFSDFNSEQKKGIHTIIHRIKDLFNKKKKLREGKGKLRGKLLMDQQILEEYKRRNEENHAYYQEQVDEYKENIEKKDSFVKQFEKKFNEVEIYVQREAKNNKNYEHFLCFEMIGFIYNNEMLHRRVMSFNDEIRQVRDEINEILKENVELKKRDEYIDMSEDFDTKKYKYKSLIKLYKGKIRHLEKNNEHLRQVLAGLNNKLQNTTSYNKDLNQQVKKGPESTISPIHKKLNSIAAIQFNEIKLKELVKNKKDGKILEEDLLDNDHHGIEEYDNDPSSSDIDENEENEENENKNNNINTMFTDLKHTSMINEEPSMLTKTPDYNMNKITDNRDIWDISCIENTNE